VVRVRVRVSIGVRGGGPPGRGVRVVFPCCLYLLTPEPVLNFYEYLSLPTCTDSSVASGRSPIITTELRTMYHVPPKNRTVHK